MKICFPAAVGSSGRSEGSIPLRKFRLTCAAWVAPAILSAGACGGVGPLQIETINNGEGCMDNLYLLEPTGIGYGSVCTRAR